MNTKFFSYFLLLISVSSYSADWSLVYTGDNELVYIDKSRISGNIAWFKTQYKNPAAVGSGEVHYQIQKSEIKCKDKQKKIIDVYFYGDNNKLLEGITVDGKQFIDAIPDSMSEYMVDGACSLMKGSDIKICEQAMKDYVYYFSINEICYNRTFNNPQVIENSFLSKCYADRKITKKTSAKLFYDSKGKVDQAILTKLYSQGKEYFCYSEREYYEKVLKKYNLSL